MEQEKEYHILSPSGGKEPQRGDYKPKEYHILSLSGGKDSTALAFYIKENMPNIHEQIEYVFYDTGLEIPETYDYLNKIEVFLNKPVLRLLPPKSFDERYEQYKMIPSAKQRWCTYEFKIKTSQNFIKEKLEKEGEGIINLYIGIRADEADRGFSSKTELEKQFIKAQYPFVDNGVDLADVEKILIKNGINYPDYYKWRSRTGCYFCFYQKKIEWIKLFENHPDLYEKAMYYEENCCKENYTWAEGFSLRELIKPQNIKAIKEKYELNKKKIIKLPTKFLIGSFA